MGPDQHISLSNTGNRHKPGTGAPGRPHHASACRPLLHHWPLWSPAVGSGGLQPQFAVARLPAEVHQPSPLVHTDITRDDAAATLAELVRTRRIRRRILEVTRGREPVAGAVRRQTPNGPAGLLAPSRQASP